MIVTAYFKPEINLGGLFGRKNSCVVAQNEHRVDFYDSSFLLIKTHYGHSLHRENAPALIGGKNEAWFFYGMLHREFGPALTLEDGTLSYFRYGYYLAHKKQENPENISQFVIDESSRKIPYISLREIKEFKYFTLDTRSGLMAGMRFKIIEQTNYGANIKTIRNMKMFMTNHVLREFTSFYGKTHPQV